MGKDYLMPFIMCRTSRGCIEVGISRNKIFTKLLKHSQHIGNFQLTEADTKALQKIYPGFCFTFLCFWCRRYGIYAKN